MSFFDSDNDFDKMTQYDTKSIEADCIRCGLLNKCKSPQMYVTGKGEKKCLIIGEASGKDEDNQGEQWVGRVGQYFRQKINKLGLDLDRDFFKINAIGCFPGDDAKENDSAFRAPSRDEIKCCRPMITKAIREFKPEFVWLMGSAAIESFTGTFFSDFKVSTWRGYCIPDQHYGVYVLPMFHPSAAAREKTPAHITSVFDRDLKHAVHCLSKKPALQIDHSKRIDCLYDIDEVINLLDTFINEPPEYLFFDYEANALKPMLPGFKIISISLAESEELAYSFPYEYRDHFTAMEKAEIRKRMKLILECEVSKKINQNVGFEYLLSAVHEGWYTQNVHHCTMIGSHILDTRPGITSLDFQTYKNFGVRPYNEHIKPLLKSRKGTHFNDIERLSLKDLLHYGSLDSHFGIRLYFQQMIEFESRKPQLYRSYKDLMLEGILDFTEMTMNGININEDHYVQAEKEMEKKIVGHKQAFLGYKYAKMFEKRYGRQFDFSDSKDAHVLFHNIIAKDLNIDMKGETKTAKGDASTGKGALAVIDDVHEVKLYQQIKMEQKVVNTYIAAFRREVINGKIHPSFHLHTARSLRGSSSDPNFQNIPEHDKKSMEICKGGIIPSKGWQILDWDFSGIEVGTGCFYHKDPNMIKYVTDKRTDMHRDAACSVCKLPVKEMTNDIKFHCGKNGWVFPQFYGEYYGNCAKVMWRESKKLKTASGIWLRDHFIKKGIGTYGAFINHCEEFEKEFWNERFKVYDGWKDKVNQDYIKTGFINTLFGFELGGVLGRNDCSNHGIQGTAFHLLLWTIIEVNKIRREKEWKTKSIGQIHDNGVEDLYPPETNKVISTIYQTGTQEIRKAFKWINIPLEIKFSITEVDGNWAEKKEIEKDELEEILKSEQVL
ncbi:hypothetical protein LCGC14_1438250 [marine sediment metagenome]|uniref:Uracil-DNA glycosylase-like domain-containing protein n=1 Tax=marine sediment metagenome TaxID=412755 RepID=A0A0F9K7N4_9ZZZZ